MQRDNDRIIIANHLTDGQVTFIRRKILNIFFILHFIPNVENVDKRKQMGRTELSASHGS